MQQEALRTVGHDEIRFLVATDVHLGHKEMHPIRKNDSYEGMEEVFENAATHEVDFLLLGGDLFDEVNPSKECYFRCMNIFGDNVFGKKQGNLEVSLNGEPYRCNFTNKKVNVSLPVFTIHGNHDYPNNEFGKISICDLLHESNYLNYFGKQLSLHKIVIRPLLITKSNCKTKIALYGLGYIKDPILNDLFESGKAEFEKPRGDLKEYFVVFVFHQNRYKKKIKTGVPLSSSFRQEYIPEWVNLTIWGHQHEAIYKTQTQNDKAIFQPGSTVITSLIGAQSLKKQCALVRVNLNSYNITSILLQKSFRPMFCLNHEVKKTEDKDLFTFMDETIANLLAESVKVNPLKKPIIRIKVEYSNIDELVRFHNIQSKYEGFVANPEKIFLTCKRKEDKNYQGSDALVFDSLKNKKLLPVMVGYAAAFKSMLSQQLAKQKFERLTPQFMQEAPLLCDSELGTCSSLVQKRFLEVQNETVKAAGQTISKMEEHNLVQFRKALKYRCEATSQIMNGELPKGYPKSKQEFEREEQEVFTSQQFFHHTNMISQQLRLKPSTKLKNDPNESKVIKNETNPSKVMKHEAAPHTSRGIKIEQISISDRSDSEDCCERASKEEINEDRNKTRFFEAKLELERMNNLKLKRDGNAYPNANKNKSKPAPKRVKYSDDFK